MRTQLLSIAFAILLVLHSNATVRIVDNNTNHPVGVYIDLTSAITASSNGDTLYIQASPTTYGPITVDKRITFIGAGFVPSFNSNFVSKVGAITIQAGFGSTPSAASGSKFIGLWIEPTGSVEAVKMFCNCINGSPLDSLRFT